MAKERTKRKRKPWLVVTGGLLALIVCCLLVLQSPLVLNRVEQGIKNAVESRLKVRFQLGKLTGNPLAGVTLHDVRFVDPISDTAVFEIDRIEAAYSLPMLLAGVFRVNHLAVDGLTADIRQVNEQHWNLWAFTPRENDAGRPDDGGSNDLSVNIRDLILTDAKLTIVPLNDANGRYRIFRSGRCRTDLRIGRTIQADIDHLSFDMTAPRISIIKSSMRVDYDYQNADIQVKNGRIETRQSQLAVDSRIRFIPDGPAYDVAAGFENLAVAELSRLFDADTGKKGSFSGQLEFSGTPGDLSHELLLRYLNSEIKSSGRLDLSSITDSGMDITGTVRRFKPADFPFLELAQMPGPINASFEFKGRHLGLANRKGRLDMAVNHSAVFGRPIDQGKCQAEILGRDISVHHLSAETPSGKFSGSGHITGLLDAAEDNRFDITGTLQAFKPELFISKPPDLASDVNLTFNAYGFLPSTFSLTEGFARVSADISSSEIGGVAIQSGDVSALLEKHQITMDRLSIKTNVGEMDGHGRIFFKDRTCRFEAAGRIPELKKLAQALPPEIIDPRLSGSLDLNAHLNGPWLSPDITFTASGRQLGWKDLIKADQCRVSGVWQGRPDQFSLSKTIDVQGLHIDGARFSELHLKTNLTPDAADIDLEGMGRGGEKIALNGTVAQWLAPEKEMTVHQMSLSAFDQPALINDRPIFIQITRNRLEIEDMHLNSGQASLDVAGAFPLSIAGGMDIRFRLVNLDLGRILGVWGLQETLSGSLSGRGKITGTTDQPEMDADLSFKNCECYGVQISEIAGSIDYRGGKANLSVAGVQNGQELFGAQGTVRTDISLIPFQFHPRKSLVDLGLTLSGFKLSDIPMLKHPEAEFDGTLQGEANILGSLVEPKISGRIQMADGFLNFNDQGLTYETVEGDIRFSPGRITIADCRIAGDREGSLQIDGAVAVEGYSLGNYVIQISGRDFYVPYKRGMDVRVRPDMRLSGRIEAPQLTGEVKVTQGRVDLDLFLEKQPSEIRVIEPPKAENGVLQIPEQAPERLKLIDPLAADISVVIPNNMWFRSKDQYVEIAGDIDLKKEAGGQFLIYGPLNVVRGTYRFRGKLFEITQGEINFIGQETINPPVRFRAETEIKDVTIIIHLSGTFQQLNLEFESIPAMERVDIISYLAFGRPSGELSSEESFKAEQAALSITGQLAADELRQVLSDILYIDYLNISAGSGDIRQGSVAMGKYVTPNVFVTYRQGFSEESPRQLEVDYEINRHFSIETQIDEEQTSGVDLIWNHEF